MSQEGSQSGLGDAALGDLVANHRRFLEFVAARVGDRQDAEENSSERLRPGAGKGRHDPGRRKHRRNAIVDPYRHRAAERRALGRQPQALVAEPEFAAAIEEAACRCVLAALEDLKPEYASLLRDVDIGGRPVAETAAGTGVTAGNARVRLHRARRALRERVELICRTCAEHQCLDCTCRTSGV